MELKKIDWFEKDEDESMWKWKFNIPNIDKTNRSCIRKWRHFVSWLRNQEIRTRIDFMKHSESSWKISESRRVLKI